MTFAKNMNKKKALIGLGAFIVLAVALVPVKPRFEGRPVMSHKDWSSISGDIERAFLDIDKDNNTLGDSSIAVHVDQLSGLDGYSVIGVESFLGRRSTSVIGYISKRKAQGFYQEDGKVWIGLDDVTSLLDVLEDSSQS